MRSSIGVVYGVALKILLGTLSQFLRTSQLLVVAWVSVRCEYLPSGQASI